MSPLCELVYLNIVVRGHLFFKGASGLDGFQPYEIRTYSDNWIESFMYGMLDGARHFVTTAASDIPLDPAPEELL